MNHLYTDETLLEGIFRQDEKVLNHVYSKFYPSIKYFILSNSGVEDDAQDIFQDAVVIVYKKVRDRQLELNCSLKTYIYSICRNLWLKQLEKRRVRNEGTFEGEDDFVALGTDIYESYEQEERFKLYQYHFGQLSEDSQKVLTLFLNKVPLSEIAKIMGYASEKYAKKRKYQIKEMLVKRIKNDPKYQELLRNESRIQQV